MSLWRFDTILNYCGEAETKEFTRSSASAPLGSCRSSNEEPFPDILEEIPDANTAVPKDEKFKTFTRSKASCKRKNAAEDEEKRYDERREAPTLCQILLFISFINCATNAFF